jgi:hypothetical protein
VWSLQVAGTRILLSIPVTHRGRLGKEKPMRKIIFWVTVASGVAAAYLMLRRGEPLGNVARETLAHPVSAFANEIQNELGT